jgi:hypothetical protein
MSVALLLGCIPTTSPPSLTSRHARHCSTARVTICVMVLLHTEAILTPEGSSHTRQHRLAPRRFATLDGVRLGLLGNSKLNADAVLLAIADRLQARYAIESVFIRSKPTFSKPAPDDIVEELVKNADVIVTGVGD